MAKFHDYCYGLLACLLLSSGALGRRILFPPVSPVRAYGSESEPQQPQPQPQPQQQQQQQSPFQIRPDGAVLPSPFQDAPKYYGLTTFANLPWEYCLGPVPSPASSAAAAAPWSESDDANTIRHQASSAPPPVISNYDIAFLGAPFDTATTSRPGARFGPAGIRAGSRRINPAFAWSAYTSENPFRKWARVVDCGDVPLTFLDNTYDLEALEAAHLRTAGRRANATSISSVPRIITLGGDHTTTLAALRATFTQWGPVSVIHFDSHLDTWDPAVLGGGFSHYAGVNHGTFLHVAHEEGLVLNSSIHAGIRAPVSGAKYDWKHDRACGFALVTARDIDRIGVAGVIERLKARVGDTNVYISVDIDVLDPAFAPATGTAEVGGWTTRELLSIIDGLEGLKVIGADVVEVAPIYDNPGETTVLAAAEVALSLMTLMVNTPVKPLKGNEL